MININENSKNPLLLFYLICDKYDDENLHKILSKYLYYYYNYLLNYNLLKIKSLENKKKSKKILIEFKNLYNSQIVILKSLKKIRTKFNKFNFWKKTLDNQIKYLEKLNDMFLSIFECSKSTINFYNKLTYIQTDNDIRYFSNVIYNRLSDTYKLFGYHFFKNNKILLINQIEFEDMSFKSKIKYTKYIFLKISLVINEYLYLFRLYKLNQNDIKNIIEPEYLDMEIEETNFDSEIDYNDILE